MRMVCVFKFSCGPIVVRFVRLLFASMVKDFVRFVLNVFYVAISLAFDDRLLSARPI